MEDIFEIKFPIESGIKDNVITKFSTKQGGAYAIFSYYWQCFVWAATIGFLIGKRKQLASPCEAIFTLNTMRNNGGEKDAQALLCMCIAREGSLEIMKTPKEAIRIISEYANAGFYHILQLMENKDVVVNDFEKVKQEIFNRDYDISFDEKVNGNLDPDTNISTYNIEIVEDVETQENETPVIKIDPVQLEIEKSRNWRTEEIERIVFLCDEHGMDATMIAERLHKPLLAIQYQLSLHGFVKLVLDVKAENTEQGGRLINSFGDVIYTDDAKLKVLNTKVFRFNMKPRCMTVKNVQQIDGEWAKGGKVLVAYSDSPLYQYISQDNYIEEIEELIEGERLELNKIKVKGRWFDYYGDPIRE